jgi:hypothetical protein
MYKSVKIFTWVVFGAMTLNAIQHFMSDRILEYLLYLLGIAYITNIVLLILKKTKNEENK